MLVGVALSVATGELLVPVPGMEALGVTLVAAAAMLVMAAVSAQPLPLIQAGASAVLVVVLQDPETGGERILDALIGGGVALVISQILLPPSPVSLLRDAGREALSSIAEGLRASVRVLRWPRCGYRNRFGIPAREETGLYGRPRHGSGDERMNLRSLGARRVDGATLWGGE